MNAWSYILTAVGVTGLYLAGKRVWWAWFVGLGAQALWLAYAITTKQYGFIISAFAYGWVYGKNGLNWWREHKAEQQKATEHEALVAAFNQAQAHYPREYTVDHGDTYLTIAEGHDYLFVDDETEDNA